MKASDLTIWKGEFASIIGSSGSGKSTLLKILGGLLPPTTGNVLLDGQDIYDEGYDMKALRSKVGLVFQYPDHQLFETTCFEDVCFGPKNQGLDRRDIELRAFEALRNVGFPEELFYQPPFDLSGGQKRRVAIAGVLAMKPDVLILGVMKSLDWFLRCTGNLESRFFWYRTVWKMWRNMWIASL